MGKNVGTGIFINQKDEYYSEIAVKSISEDCTKDDDIPEETHGATNLKDIREKTVITYWTKFISKKMKPKTKTEVSNSKTPCKEPIRKTTTCTATNVPISDDESNSEEASENLICTAKNADKLKKSGDSKKAVKRKRKEKTTENSGDSQKKGLKRKRKAKMIEEDQDSDVLPNTLEIENKDGTFPRDYMAKTGPDDNYSFVLMEWAKGALFWGVKRGLPMLDDMVVQNCSKSCGKISDKQVDFEAIFENTKVSKLSNSDYQVNPDMSFLVLEVPKDEFLLLQKSSGSVKNDSISIKPDCRDTFMKKVAEGFRAYISESN